MIENISFIVIARNEEFGVNKCLESIATMNPVNCEVICVDSDSSDNTLEVMKSYTGKIDNLRVIQISGNINAAIARNTGMQYATRDYIFFVDGDVELYPNFIRNALSRIKSGKADAVTGKLLEIQYTPDYQNELRRVERRKHMTQEETCLMTGGIFIVSRQIVEWIGKWDPSFWRLQDFDYTLRISKAGRLIQVPDFIGVHHTQEFYERSWLHLRKGYPVLYGHLLRKHLRAPRFAFALVRGNRGLGTFLITCALLLLSLGTAAVFSFPLFYSGIVVILCILGDFVFSYFFKKSRVTPWMRHNYLEPPMILFGLLTRPKKHEIQTRQSVIV